MHDYESKRRKAFNLLDRIGDLDKQELEEHFTDDNIESIRILWKSLLGDKILPKLTSPSKFAELVYELRKTKRTWGRKLGDAIILAYDMADKNGVETAIDVLKEFIKRCPSPFHREHAQNQLEYYIREGAKKET